MLQTIDHCRHGMVPGLPAKVVFSQITGDIIGGTDILCERQLQYVGSGRSSMAFVGLVQLERIMLVT